MAPKEKAKELVDTFKPNAYRGACEENDELMELYHSKQCALKAVDEIILANPHSNPLNTDVYSTMSYWQEVKQEIEKL